MTDKPVGHDSTLEAALNGLPSALLVIDGDSDRVLFANEEAKRLMRVGIPTPSSLRELLPNAFPVTDGAVIEFGPEEAGRRLRLTCRAGDFGGRSARFLELREADQTAAGERDRRQDEWRLAMDAIDDAICFVDTHDRVVWANRAFLQAVGRTGEQIAGQPAKQVLHGDASHAGCPLCNARERQRDLQLTLEADHPANPTGKPMDCSIRLLRDEHGAITGTLMVMHDLSGSRLMDNEMRRLNEQVMMLLESAGEGIFGIDQQGSCTFINRAALSMLGYTRSEVNGRGIHPLIHHSREDGSAYPLGDCPMWRAVREGRATRTTDEVLWCKDGSSFPADYSAHPIVEEGRISGAVVVFRNVAEERALAKKMDYLATHDPLTGLLNRRVFELRTEKALTSARRLGREHVLCYLDLDQFKVVNDTCGHMAGDELLRQVGALLHGQLSDTDTIGRLGGDEFGILVENTLLHDALPLINTLQQTVHGLRFAWDNKTFVLGASIGVVTLSAETESFATALSAADTACYVAKESGRNRIHVHEPGDEELTRKRGEMQWVSHIHDALENDRFVLRYQPIIPLTAGHAPGERYEILVSMRDNRGRLVPPSTFIPAAERFNLMVAVDRWVFHSTISWLADNPAQTARLAWLTINLSGTTLGDESFVDTVIRHFEITGIPPEKVCFEITETAAVSNLSRALSFIERLTKLGCRFALDDFGSGMSSFAYLRSLPVDFLKIDGNFVREIVADQVDRAMVEAIHQVGHAMHIPTIAEHLESREIMEVVKSIGIDYGQGYSMGAPRMLATLGDR